MEFWKAYSWYEWIELTIAWHPQKPFFILSFAILEPNDLASRKVSGRIYCTQKSLWKLNWFLRDFGYDTDLLGRDEVEEKALLGLTGVLRTTRKTFAGRVFVNLEGFAPSSEWEFISKDAREGVVAGGSNDLQLHADSPVPAMSAEISLPVSRRRARKGRSGLDDFWSLL